MAAQFQFSAIYKPEAVRSAALALFRNQQRTNLTLTLGSTILVAVVCVLSGFYMHFYWMLWVPLVFLAADLLLRVFVRRRFTSGLAQNLVGQSVRFEITEEAFAFSLKNADHKLPWTHIRKAQLEPDVLLLYLTRYGAVVVPVAEAPAGAIDFAIAHVSPKTQVA